MSLILAQQHTLISIGPGEALENYLVLKSSCVCPGYVLTLECTVAGTPFGTTVWKGSFFDCQSNGITLVHNDARFTVEKKSCNNGSVVGGGVAVNGNSYTSQLNITVNDEVIGRAVECYYDLDRETLLGTQMINITG